MRCVSVLTVHVVTQEEIYLKDFQLSFTTQPIEIFGNYSNEKCLRNFPLIMPYLRHIIEQPIERFYCSLLVSLKVRIRTIYVVDSFV